VPKTVHLDTRPIYLPAPSLARASCTGRCGQYLWPFLQFLKDNRKKTAHLIPYLIAPTRQTSETGGMVDLSGDDLEALAAAHMHTPITTKLRRLLE